VISKMQSILEFNDVRSISVIRLDRRYDTQAPPIRRSPSPSYADSVSSCSVGCSTTLIEHAYSSRPCYRGSHCRRMPLTATRVGGPQWGTARTIDHAVAVVLDHKECSGMSPGVRRPHRSSGVIDHEVAVCLHRDETGSGAVSSTRPEWIR